MKEKERGKHTVKEYSGKKKKKKERKGNIAVVSIDEVEGRATNEETCETETKRW